MSRTTSRWFYVGVALLTILINIAGFAPSLVDSSGRLAPLTLGVAAHAAVSSAFLLLFLAQAALVATGRTRVHRRFGFAGAVLAALLIVLTWLMAVETSRRGYDLSGDLQRLGSGGQVLALDALRTVAADTDRRAALAFNAGLVLSFGILVGTAIWYRSRPQVHKRLMLFAMVGVMTGPPLAHMFGHWPALTEVRGAVQVPVALLLLSMSAIHDRWTDGRVHRLSVWLPLGLFAWTPVWLAVIGPSAPWQRFAGWLIG